MAKANIGKAGTEDGTAAKARLDGDRIDWAVAAVLARDPEARSFQVNMMRAMTVTGVAIFLMSSLLAWFCIQPVSVVFVRSTSDGENTRLQSLAGPINTNAEIRNWVVNSVVQAYTMSFANPEASLAVSRPNFTPGGWAGFKKALEDSGNLKSVSENKYFTTAIPNGAPVLLDSPPVDGKPTWKFQIPILVTYTSSSKQVTSKYLVTALAVSQPAWDNVRTLGISTIVTQ